MSEVDLKEKSDRIYNELYAKVEEKFYVPAYVGEFSEEEILAELGYPRKDIDPLYLDMLPEALADHGFRREERDDDRWLICIKGE